MYLIDRTPIDYLGEICGLDDESAFGGLAAQMRSNPDIRFRPVAA
jgi:hypothetical protein